MGIDQSTTLPPADDLPPRAILVDDPARAAAGAQLLQNGRELDRRAEHRAFTGTWRGGELLIASHEPSDIARYEELAKGGVRTVIRVATCASMQPKVRDGDLVIPEGCIRNDGLAHELVPEPYPALAAGEIVAALSTAAGESGAGAHCGIVWTRATFYPGQLAPSLDRYSRAGVLAMDADLSALLVVGSLHGLRAGGLLVVDGAAAGELRDTRPFDPDRPAVPIALDRAMRIALDAVVGPEPRA